MNKLEIKRKGGGTVKDRKYYEGFLVGWASGLVGAWIGFSKADILNWIEQRSVKSA